MDAKTLIEQGETLLEHMSVLDEYIQAWIHNYGNIERMQLHFYSPDGEKWDVDPKKLKEEGHEVVPKNEWKNFNKTPFAIFYEEDVDNQEVFIKFIFHLDLNLLKTGQEV